MRAACRSAVLTQDPCSSAACAGLRGNLVPQVENQPFKPVFKHAPRESSAAVPFQVKRITYIPQTGGCGLIYRLVLGCFPFVK